MKIQKTTQPATFQPVVLTITIENESEQHSCESNKSEEEQE